MGSTLGFALAFALHQATAAAAVTPSEVRVSTEIGPTGEPTAVWRDAVARLRGKPVDLGAKQITAPEAGWLRLITERSRIWPAETPALIANFPDIQPPPEVLVMVGNQGAEDAFVHDGSTIAFDVSRLAQVYGPPASGANSDRLDRFFRHEYVHLLQKRWLARHRFEAVRPIDRAMLGMWTEGLGNYYSLSERWRSPDGTLSPTAKATLARLSPLLVARLAGLSCATAPVEASLVADLSAGPFEGKWGALPVALWLAEEAASSPTAIRDFARGGPASVWELLNRRLDAPLKDVLDAARAQDQFCPAREDNF